MISCPSCGTRNRRGSKYCYRCGQRLDIAFDVSCPDCDRLNPAGSAFCAFCGARFPGSTAAKSAVAQQPPQAAQELPASESTGAESVATAQGELPPWLYEHVDTAASATDAPPTAATAPLPGQSKYLNDIPGALPQTQGWLSSVLRVESEPAATKSVTRQGCLALVLPALLVVAGLALVGGM